jgi:hypothetical protein
MRYFPSRKACNARRAQPPMLLCSAKLFGALILTIGDLLLAEAQCKKPKDEDTPHGANEFILHDEGAVGRVHGRVFFTNYAIEAGRIHADDIVVELYSYSGGESYQDVNKVLRWQKRVAACLTGADGRFSFARLKPGRYLLRAGTRKRDQYNEIYVILKLDPKRGDSKELEFELKAGT